jgi:hypothetical protein
MTTLHTGESYSDGYRAGLATAAVAVSLVSFVNLLGMEKSLLAIVLSFLAMGGTVFALARRRARIAIGLGLVQIASMATILIVYHDKLLELLHLLQKLG